MDVVIPDLAPAGAAVVTVQPGPGKGGSKRNRSGAAAGGKGVMESEVTPMEMDPANQDEPPSVAVPFLRQVASAINPSFSSVNTVVIKCPPVVL